MERQSSLCICVAALLACFAPSAHAVAKSEYLDVIEMAVDAYTPKQTADYIASARDRGMREHGFGRFVVNHGVLLAAGRRASEEDRARVSELMDIYCGQVSGAKARNGRAVGNDFTVKEVVLCLLELEKAKAFPTEVTERWRAGLAKCVPGETYTCIPPPDDPIAHNWAVFAGTSEQLRCHAGLGGEAAFVERQYGGQVKWLDVNGMYRDPNQPIAYDLVTRLQFMLGCTYGYKGRHRELLEQAFLKSAEPTLLMQSASGEFPYGGRSNQFLHSDIMYAAVCEWYASWFKSRGDMSMARRFRACARRADESLLRWSGERPLRHVKNRHSPRTSLYGCEKYGYFDKYMITLGSMAFCAYLVADESIPDADVPEDGEASAFVTSPDFHLAMVRAGGYSAQFDYPADGHYDASGIGRIQRRGAPSAICLSVPAAKDPSYMISVTNETPFAIIPGWLDGDGWKYAYETAYSNLSVAASNGVASLGVDVAGSSRQSLRLGCTASADGVELSLSGAGEIALTLPAFISDGRMRTTVNAGPSTLDVLYCGWTCRFEAEGGTIVDTGMEYGNRNGIYRRYEVRGRDMLAVRVTIFKDVPKSDNPLDFPSYVQKVVAEFEDEEQAKRAEVGIAPLPHGAPVAFSCRWDDSVDAHLAKSAMMLDAGVKGTFYLTAKGSFAERHARDLVAAGHAVGNHTIAHPHMETLSADAAFRQIMEQRIKLELNIDRTVNSYVSPFGWAKAVGENKPLMHSVMDSVVFGGHYVSQDGRQWWCRFAPSAWMWTNRFNSGDKDPKRWKFEQGFAAKRAAAATNGVPRVTLGTHSWCDAKGTADQGKWLREFFHEPGAVQMNDWEYGSYRYSYLHGYARKSSVRGRTAVVEVLRYHPAFLGDEIPLSISFSERPVSVSCESAGGELEQDGATWTLPHDGDRHMVQEVSDSLPGVEVDVQPDEKRGTVHIAVANKTGKTLSDTTVVAVLPPKWSRRRHVANCGDVAPGKSVAVDVETGGPSGLVSFDDASYYPVSVDFSSGGVQRRIWCKATQTPAEGRPGIGKVFGGVSKVNGGPAEKGRFCAVEEDRLYVGGEGTLAVYDIAANPMSPKQLGVVRDLPTLRQIAVQDGIVYATARASGLWIIDCRSPENPRVAGHYPSVANCTGVDVAGDVCFVGGSKSGIEYFDVRDPCRPQLIGCDRFAPVESQSVFYKDGFLYSGEWGPKSVTIWDVRDMASRRRTAAHPLMSNGDGVYSDRGVLYAVTGFSVDDKKPGAKSHSGQMGLETYDVSDPARPKRLGRVDFEYCSPCYLDSWIVKESAGIAFCAQTRGGLYAVDVRDPARPRVADRWLAQGRPSVLSVAIGDGVVYATTLGAGTFAISAKGAEKKARQRGALPANAGVRPLRPPPPEGFVRWVPSDKTLVFNVTGLAVYGDFCYAAAGTAGLFVLELREGSIAETARIPLDEAMDCSVAGNRLFVAAGAGGWVVYELSRPERPCEIARIPGVFARDVYAYGDGTRWAGLNTSVFDVSDMGSPKQLACLVHQARYNKFLTPGIIGGRWVAGNSALKDFRWVDLFAPDIAETVVQDYRSHVGGICPFGENAFVADGGRWVVSSPGARQFGEMRAFPGGEQVVGIPRWDGSSRICISGNGNKAWLWDFSNLDSPALLRRYTLPGTADVAAFWRGIPVFPARQHGVLVGCGLIQE